MTREVVEVISRFGDTVLDIAHVDATETYRIGTARDVDVAVPGLTSFPLVDRGIVRLPVGVPTRQDAGATELQFAGVTLRVTRCGISRGTLRRPRIQWRLAAFGIGSLIVHLALWFAALVFEPFEPVVHVSRPRLRHARIHPPSEPARPPESTRDPAPPAAAQPTQDERLPAPGRAARRTLRDPTHAETLAGYASAANDVAAMIKSTRVVERVGELRPEDNFTEDDTYTSGFGGSRRMGSGETIKTAEGYQLMLLNDVKLCPRRSCTVRGPVPASFVRAQLHEIMPAIYACYLKHADAPGTITLEFTIKGDGSVSNPSGHGLGETGACVAKHLSGIYFKAIGDNDVPEGKQRHTTVRYPLQFTEPL